MSIAWSAALCGQTRLLPGGTAQARLDLLQKSLPIFLGWSWGMGSVCSWYHRGSGNALFGSNSGRAMSGLFTPSTLALVFSVNLHFTQQCFHKIHNKGAAIQGWRNIQPSWFASFDVKIHHFPHNFQGTLSHVVFVHIKSAGGQVVLSQIHGMKGLQGLEKFVWTWIWDLPFPQYPHPGWSQGAPVIPHGNSFTGKFPAQLLNEGGGVSSDICWISICLW